LATLKGKQAKKHEQLTHAKEATKTALEKQGLARTAMRDTEGNTTAARLTLFKCNEAVQKAEADLQEAVTHMTGVIDAQSALNERKKEEAEAHKVFENLSEENKTMYGKFYSATEELLSRSKEQQAASEAASTADAAVAGQEQAVAKAIEGAKHPEAVVENVTAAVKAQDALVKSLKAASDQLHEEKNHTIAAYSDAEKEVQHDGECIQELQAKESASRSASSAFQAGCAAYGHATGGLKAHFRGVLWQESDQSGQAEYDLFQVKKRCASPGVEIAEVPPPPVCADDTGGRCRILYCYASRNATCDTNQGYKCLCTPDSCSRDGTCVDRGEPPCAAASQQLAAGTGHAEAPAANLVLAFLALSVPAAAAVVLAVRKQRRREIEMPVDLLG